MMIDRKYAALSGSITGTVTAGLILFGVAVVLGNPIDTRNLLAFTGFGVLVGLVTALLVFFRLKIAAAVFLGGLLFGYFEMFRAFFNKMGGWGDLAGILSIFLWPIVGLALGLILQTGSYAYKKWQAGKKND